MGLIKAFAGAVTTTLADQWKEYFYCEALDKDVLAAKGKKRINDRKSSNKKGSENIISKGSIIAVADGQCMVIVEQGRIVEFAAEPGAYEFDSSTESSIFAGSFGEGVIGLFKTIGKRFTFGGDTAKDQRVYYFNTKELVDNKFGTANPVPFRVVDNNVGLDIDVSVRCNGVYSYKITNPILFYQNVCGNFEGEYRRSELDQQLKTEFISALQPAFGKLSEMEMRPNQIIAHITELENAMNTVLDEKWRELRGIEVISIALGSVTLPKEDEDLIKELQRKNVLARNPGMAGATLVEAQAEAMKGAASNAHGAAMGFYGLNMAANAGGMNAQSFYDMNAKQQQQKQEEAKASSTNGSWKCPQCNTMATGKFCPECGQKKPEDNSWTCSCGTLNKGKFCSNCGQKKPELSLNYKCSKCGFEVEDKNNLPKFCPECGNPFGK